LTTVLTARTLPIIRQSPTVLGLLGYGIHETINYHKHGRSGITLENITYVIAGSALNGIITQLVTDPITWIIGDGVMSTVLIPITAISTTSLILYNIIHRNHLQQMG